MTRFNFFMPIAFALSVLCCEKETECIIIQDKYGGNGTFYFQWDRTTRGNTEMQIGTGSVSENIFNQYDIGDIYCIEELML